MNVISCKRLTKRFGPTVAVSELDLEVSAGQVYGFLGPNGAGKTTTIRMLVGLIAPTAGQIRLLGRSLPDPGAVAQTGSMIEEPAFYPWLTGRQNLKVLAATGGGCDAAEFGRVLEVTGLSEVAGRKVRAYSQGMRQRLGLAAAMLGRPPLLIIDEPTNGLDPAGIRDDPRPAARSRGGRDDRVHVQPPAGRGRAGLRPGSGHRPRPDRRGGRACAARRNPAADPGPGRCGGYRGRRPAPGPLADSAARRPVPGRA